MSDRGPLTDAQRHQLIWLWETAHNVERKYYAALRAGINIDEVLDSIDFIELFYLILDVDRADDLHELIYECSGSRQFVAKVAAALGGEGK